MQYHICCKIVLRLFKIDLIQHNIIFGCAINVALIQRNIIFEIRLCNKLGFNTVQYHTWYNIVLRLCNIIFDIRLWNRFYFNTAQNYGWYNIVFTYLRLSQYSAISDFRFAFILNWNKFVNMCYIL